MIFMRALLTTIIGQCRVKALNTKLAIACLYKAVGFNGLIKPVPHTQSVTHTHTDLPRGEPSEAIGV